MWNAPAASKIRDSQRAASVSIRREAALRPNSTVEAILSKKSDGAGAQKEGQTRSEKNSIRLVKVQDDPPMLLAYQQH